MPRRKSFETFYPRYWRVYLATCPLAGLLYAVVAGLSLVLVPEAKGVIERLIVFTCLWLPCQQVFVLILMMNWRISIDDRGIGEYDIYNTAKRLYWDDVETASIYYFVGFPVLTIEGCHFLRTNHPLRVRIPLFMYHSDKIVASIADFAGPDHPVALAAVERYRDAD